MAPFERFVYSVSISELDGAQQFGFAGFRVQLIKFNENLDPPADETPVLISIAVSGDELDVAALGGTNVTVLSNNDDQGVIIAAEFVRLQGDFDGSGTVSTRDFVALSRGRSANEFMLEIDANGRAVDAVQLPSGIELQVVDFPNPPALVNLEPGDVVTPVGPAAS
ncbi:MAG: hypothetical protein AB8B71_07825, partial [Paracoccaceae bacterium]